MVSTGTQTLETDGFTRSGKDHRDRFGGFVASRASCVAGFSDPLAKCNHDKDVCLCTWGGGGATPGWSNQGPEFGGTARTPPP